MYHYVTDKEFLKQSYSICADIVNQLVQHLKHYDIDAAMVTVGSKKRGLITQNGNQSIDYDFNLIIHNANKFRHAKDLKDTVMVAFNEVLSDNGWKNCQDSTSAITTKQQVLKKGNKTPFKIDLCIIKIDSMGRWHRLIHRKTGNIALDQHYWNIAPYSEQLQDMEKYLKPNYWPMVRKRYLEKKNMYLTRNEDHPSFICYIEALNEVYNQVQSLHPRPSCSYNCELRRTILNGAEFCRIDRTSDR